MNEALRQTAIFIRDLLDYDEQLIKIGRDNDEIEEFETAYIGVDSLGAAQRLAGGRSYNGAEESETLQQQWRSPVIVSFYGDGAHGRAHDFALRIGSQPSLELQESQGIAVYQASELTDVRVLTGQQYGERIELTLNVQYSTSVEIATLRIDTAKVEVLTESGQEPIQ